MEQSQEQEKPRTIQFGNTVEPFKGFVDTGLPQHLTSHAYLVPEIGSIKFHALKQPASKRLNTSVAKLDNTYEVSATISLIQKQDSARVKIIQNRVGIITNIAGRRLYGILDFDENSQELVINKWSTHTLREHDDKEAGDAIPNPLLENALNLATLQFELVDLKPRVKEQAV